MSIDFEHVTPPDLPRVPWIPPVLRRVWRGPDVLQIGADPDRAVVLEGVTPALAEFLASIDGFSPLERYLTEQTVPRTLLLDTLRRLHRAGCVVDLAPGGQPPEPARHPMFSGRLVPEIAARSLGALDSQPAEVISRRAHARVIVVGGRRLGPMLGSLLATSGIGRVDVIAHGRVEASDVIPGGAPEATIGEARQAATRGALRQLHRDLATGPLTPSESPDLVILADPWPVSGERERSMRAAGTPYLCTAVRERRAVIGPFVLPRESSCLRCQELYRTDHDPQWRAVAAQLAHAPSRAAESGEIATVTLAAGFALSHALQWLDGERFPESINATVEIALPELTVSRRHWPRHQLCECW
ncbi:hypothetical protein EK0264_15805 [Epidermidibacterium keratini]|uniref:THIF-type NAD/FAD binding fold domain-containing protein n=1 Tax=Epidermidibacterium keratini TaxID=1891644 RepID=A0A7L4YS33_9ACTN|nr:ThiF family adenylyltransferase [Epidermidibacterium keratini]QHC01609.1 hypothetical protein EK0264_15805 [Epidermidibacterium keratini]